MVYEGGPVQEQVTHGKRAGVGGGEPSALRFPFSAGARISCFLSAEDLDQGVMDVKRKNTQPSLSENSPATKGPSLNPSHQQLLQR